MKASADRVIRSAEERHAEPGAGTGLHVMAYLGPDHHAVARGQSDTSIGSLLPHERQASCPDLEPPTPGAIRVRLDGSHPIRASCVIVARAERAPDLRNGSAVPDLGGFSHVEPTVAHGEESTARHQEVRGFRPVTHAEAESDPQAIDLVDGSEPASDGVTGSSN